MTSSTRTARSGKNWLAFVALVAVFFVADAASAQIAGGGRGGRRGKPPKEKEPPRGEQQEDEKPAPGRQVGWVLRLKAATEKDVEKDEDLMGFLSVKPYEKKGRIVKLRVRKNNDVRIELGDHKFELEDLGKILGKGMHVAASWDFLNEKEAEKKRGGKKVLRKLELVTIEVEGEVKEIKDDMVTVYGKPINKARWPDYQPDDKPGTMPDEVKKMALDLKLMEDISKFRTTDSDDAGLSDFKEGDEVRLRVVFAGRKTGILVAMRSKDASDVPETKEDEGGDRPPARGPRPRQPGRRGG